MKKASLVVSKYLQNNNIFDINSILNRDNILSPFYKLKQKFFENGYDLNTSDICSISEAEVVIYMNMPKILPNQNDIEKSYLILSESNFIKPENYNKDKHKYFNKIFTWHDNLIDNKKYFKLNFSHKFPDNINKNVEAKEKLCVMISANKTPPYTIKNDLYYERQKAIRWFEKKHINDFDLYGIGWDKYNFGGPKIIRALNKIPVIGKIYTKITNKEYKSYKGEVDNKKEVMEKYKFSICYENAKDIPGYITEKIFDSFFAGCVPIYWGANNITDYVPKECFIDRRNFENYEDLYEFLQKINKNKYMLYIKNISSYLKSEKSYIFTDKYYAEKIVNTVLKQMLIKR